MLPRHIAIIMDGNGRWATQRFMPRIAGHKAGVDSVRKIVKACVEKKIEVLTLWAFGNENWKRPQQEVSFLMNLMTSMMENEIKKIHEENIQLHIIGDRSRLDKNLQQKIAQAEQLTANNSGLKLIIAFSYSGYWDITEAMRKIAVEIQENRITPTDISPELIQQKLALANFPDPDLFIRSSGEQRLSNFLLWNLAYTELYFTNVFWPDFDVAELEKALLFFASRERRFGATSEQLQAGQYA